jgi:hypothetical protein
MALRLVELPVVVLYAPRELGILARQPMERLPTAGRGLYLSISSGCRLPQRWDASALHPLRLQWGVGAVFRCRGAFGHRAIVRLFGPIERVPGGHWNHPYRACLWQSHVFDGASSDVDELRGRPVLRSCRFLALDRRGSERLSRLLTASAGGTLRVPGFPHSECAVYSIAIYMVRSKLWKMGRLAIFRRDEPA